MRHGKKSCYSLWHTLPKSMEQNHDLRSMHFKCHHVEIRHLDIILRTKKAQCLSSDILEQETLHHLARQNNQHINLAKYSTSRNDKHSLQKKAKMHCTCRGLMTINFPIRCYMVTVIWVAHQKNGQNCHSRIYVTVVIPNVILMKDLRKVSRRQNLHGKQE